MRFCARTRERERATAIDRYRVTTQAFTRRESGNSRRAADNTQYCSYPVLSFLSCYFRVTVTFPLACPRCLLLGKRGSFLRRRSRVRPVSAIPRIRKYAYVLRRCDVTIISSMRAYTRDNSGKAQRVSVSLGWNGANAIVR